MSKQSYLDAALQYAGMEQGTPEWTNFINEYNSESGYQYDGDWCAEFAAWISIVSGNKGLMPLQNWSYGQYEYLRGQGATLYTPDQFTIYLVPSISFDFDRDAPGNTEVNHMGVVVDYDLATRRITTVEGNMTVNGVNLAYMSSYSLDNPRFKYFYAPPEWIGSGPVTPGGGGQRKINNLPPWLMKARIRRI